jgi:mono/diheme cytochrome c family protein
MRRFLLAIAVISLALGLAGCGATSGLNDPTTTRPYPNTVEGTVSTTTTQETGGEGDAAAGKAVFNAQGCAACHTLADANASGKVGPNLDEAKPSSELVVERVTNGMGVMPSFKDRLSAKEIADVAAYVSSVAGK